MAVAPFAHITHAHRALGMSYRTLRDALIRAGLEPDEEFGGKRRLARLDTEVLVEIRQREGTIDGTARVLGVDQRTIRTEINRRGIR